MKNSKNDPKNQRPEKAAANGANKKDMNQNDSKHKQKESASSK
jgi:hypothetical protein